MSTTGDEDVRLDVTVEATVERAFQVFTEQFDQVKPREHNLLAPEEVVETVLEPRVGGDVYDRGADGGTCRWGRVLAFEPPHRLVFSWDISPTWQLVTDPAEASEVEVSFTEAGPGRTRVELVHRHLARHGAGWESLRDGVADQGGWPLYLERYAALVD
ncbi:uncharacterized protein YndB with AHSA1/START domain [Nocardioides sp. J9]|uniref:SRPBCC family protein n=1 Tax=unclassified Nocardioides TaxID=2615069 RepID=UPI00048D67BB|nr:MULTISPECIES: SRPBCC family protein [unclassified Nocardioides]TWH00560.1 uncharacterized protein YndB with AHSA1/START domain [Nocardioides sp. J9]